MYRLIKAILTIKACMMIARFVFLLPAIFIGVVLVTYLQRL